MKGTVVWFNEMAGYGMADGSDGKKVFLHYTNTRSELRLLVPGDKIEYDLYEDSKGRFYAMNIQKEE